MGMLQLRGKKVPQLVIAFPVRCRKGKHGDPQTLLQKLMVDLLFLSPGHVHHIQKQHGGLIQSGELRRHIHAALQLRGVHKDADQVGPAAFYKLRSNDFLVRIAGKAVAAGQIRHGIALPSVNIIAVVFLNGLSGPVAHMLPGPGQGIEYGRFAGIRLSQ